MKHSLKRQMQTSYWRVCTLIVVIVGGHWLIDTMYHEWKLMRIVSVITQTLQQSSAQPEPAKLPAPPESTRC